MHRNASPSQGCSGAVRIGAPHARRAVTPPFPGAAPDPPPADAPGTLRPPPRLSRPRQGPKPQRRHRTTGPFLRKQWDRRKLELGVVGNSEVIKSRLPRPAGIPYTPGDPQFSVCAWAVPSTGSSLPLSRKPGWVQVSAPPLCDLNQSSGPLWSEVASSVKQAR